ncbi:MAG: hypothetical protein ACREWG_05415 [Gammaproteobacteria bacterium]
MTTEMLFALVFGVGLLAGYVALGVLCAKKTWQWSTGLTRRWVRVLLVSAVITLIFCPGVIAAGHGAGIGPAWLMFASGAFNSLTSSSKRNMLLFVLAVWIVVFVVGLLVSRVKSTK